MKVKKGRTAKARTRREKISEFIDEHYIGVMRWSGFYFIMTMLIHVPLLFINTYTKYLALFLLVTALVQIPIVGSLQFGKETLNIWTRAVNEVKSGGMEPWGIEQEEGMSVLSPKVKNWRDKHCFIIMKLFMAFVLVAGIADLILYCRNDITRPQLYGIMEMIIGVFLSLRMFFIM